jgi:hypothetical protein
MKTWRLTLIVVAASALASALAVHAAAGPPNHANRFEARFTETGQSVTDRLADLQTLQFITTGNGEVEGFGAATVVVGITQDHLVTPCGPGSWINAATRRIMLSKGMLVLNELSNACLTASGPVITGRYRVDGLSSTGIFAGARGTGTVTINIAASTSTLSGKLLLTR